MAVIQKLRDKYAKLTGGVIVVALLGFILMDYGRGGRAGDSTIGKIDGQKVAAPEYDSLIQKNENLMRQQSQGQDLTADQEANLRDQVWQQLVSEKLMAKMDEKLGIQVTDAEVNNLLTGSNPDPMVKQQFTNPQTGRFDPQEVAVQIQQIKKDPDKKALWTAFQNDLIERHLNQKAISLLVGAIYVPKFVLDDQVKGMTDIADAQYVKIPFTTIPDNQAKVTDNDINQYIKAHAKMFDIPKTTRSIEFVSFAIAPSQGDSSKVIKALDTLKNSFATTVDTEVEAFVNHNSINPTTPTYFTRDQLNPLTNADQLMNGSVGEIIGPFFDGGSFDLARIMEKRSLPDSVHIRHILVAVKQGNRDIRSDAAAKARIDSAVAAINAGMPFDTVAARFSDDPNSRTGINGNPFGLTQKNSLESAYGKEFADYAFDGAAGSSKVIKVDMENYTAYNYIQVISQTAPVQVVKLAFVSMPLNPSDETNKGIYSKASQFANQAATSKKGFDEVAATSGLTGRPADGLDPNSWSVNGLGSARDLVKWAFDKETKFGDVSPIFTVNNNYVVAKLIAEQPKGLLKITDQNRPMLSAMVIKEKKAKIIMDKYGKNKPASLDVVAQQAQQTVATIDSLRFGQSFAPNLGGEPKVIGYAFNPAFKLNTVSPAIPGNDGVFFMTVTNRAAGPVPPQVADRTQLKSRLVSGLRQAAPQIMLNSMIEHADVKDMRGEIY